MARDTDRKVISEAVRTQPLRNDGTPLWKRQAHGETLYNKGSYVVFTTEYDESLTINYGPKGRIVYASYRHWDNDLKIAHDHSITGRANLVRLITTGRLTQ